MAKYFHYDINNHNHDFSHADVITNLMASQLGDMDGCLTVLDFHIPLTALVCARLGKPGIPYSSARLVNNKRLTLEALRKQSTVDTLHSYASRCWSVERVEDVEEAARHVGFPAVLKMESGAGGLSVKVVYSMEDAQEQFEQVQNHCNMRLGRGDYNSMIFGAGFGSSCVFMEYLQGSEHCVDLALYHGELLCAFVTDKQPQVSAKGKFHHGICIIPSQLPKAKEVEVIRAAVDCCKGLGLHHGVFDVDIMLTGSGPKLIEINARVGGFCQREFVLRCYGVDLLHLACFLACDVRPTFSSISCIDDDISMSRKDTTATETPVIDVCSVTQRTGSNDGRRVSEAGQRNIPSSLPALKPRGSVVGLQLYPGKHGQALKTTASPATLQKLHEDGEMLFLKIDPELRETNDPMVPFCTLAVHGQSFSATRCRLQKICMEIGIEASDLNDQQ